MESREPLATYLACEKHHPVVQSSQELSQGEPGQEAQVDSLLSEGCSGKHRHHRHIEHISGKVRGEGGHICKSIPSKGRSSLPGSHRAPRHVPEALQVHQQECARADESDMDVTAPTEDSDALHKGELLQPDVPAQLAEEEDGWLQWNKVARGSIPTQPSQLPADVC